MSRRKLLLADDSITIQKVVNLTFADEGIEVIAVGDGNSALDRMQETPPDLVMADVNMPGLSGYELCERIKQNERLRHIPVILLVGSFEPFDEREAARVGADDYLTKPFQSIRQLVNKVTGMLETTENRQASAMNASPVGGSAGGVEDGALAAANDSDRVESGSPYEATAADDEMIETSYVGGFPLDETRKFESRTFDADDAGEMQPLSATDLQAAAFAGETPSEFQTGESAPEFDTSEINYKPTGAESVDFQDSRDAQPDSATPAPKPAPPVFDFDDLNLLNIPLDEEEIAVESAAPDSPSAAVQSATETELQKEVSGSDTQTAENLSGETEAEFVEEIKEAEEGKTVAETETETIGEGAAANFSFPPEVIEAIAQKVAEKLSAQTASEVAPRVADLIIQKIAEEKLKS